MPQDGMSSAEDLRAPRAAATSHRGESGTSCRVAWAHASELEDDRQTYKAAQVLHIHPQHTA
jgi:hypothetical protein